MKRLTNSLQTKVHDWIDTFGFRLNASQTNKSRSITIKHYFFKTFDFVERADNRHPEKSRFICFDAYGEKIKVNTLLDLQAAFFENISQLK